MDFVRDNSNIILIVVMLLMLVLAIYIKSRRELRTPLGRVIVIFSQVKHNVKLVENFGYHHNVGRLKTGAWNRNKDRVAFLPQDLQETLAHTFEMSDEVNQRIDAARKFKSDSYMAGIDVEKLKAPLARSQQQLQEWLQANMSNPEYLPKRRGLFG